MLHTILILIPSKIPLKKTVHITCEADIKIFSNYYAY